MSNNTFVIRRTSDDLQHWKYIKKKKVNGKWRYYYDKEQFKDDLGFDERADYNRAKAALNQAKGIRNKRKNEYKAYSNNIRNRSDKNGKVTMTIKPIEESKLNKEKELESKYLAAQAVYNRGVKEYYKAVAKYEKTPMYTLDKVGKVINRGKNAVKRLFKIH